MKNLSSKVIRNAYKVLENYKSETTDKAYHLNSLISYFVETDIRTSLKEKKLNDAEIDTLFSVLDLKVNFEINKNSFKFNVNYR